MFRSPQIGRSRLPPPSPRGSGTERRLVYAIGDVHGRADLLARLLDTIDADAAHVGCEPTVRFLGDIVDRGPDSRGALDQVAETLRRWPTSRLLLGNHDDALLSFLEGETCDGEWFDVWQNQGGRETLVSYDVDPDEPETAQNIMRKRYPEHRALLKNASLIEIDETFAFVHAGVDPDRPIDRQIRRDCLHIRARFMNHVGRLDRIVVHGHTPQKPPRALATENRISLDTGAYFSGVLTALVIDEGEKMIRTIATTKKGGIVHGVPEGRDRGLGTALDLFDAVA
jgi:serine/threonine protein phosphatase 1